MYALSIAGLTVACNPHAMSFAAYFCLGLMTGTKDELLLSTCKH